MHFSWSSKIFFSLLLLLALPSSIHMAKRYERLKDFLAAEYPEFDPSIKSQRLKSLYSDFSTLHQVNEFGYNANVDYWRAVLLDCSLHGYLNYNGYTLVLDKRSLAQDFLWKNEGKPLALDCVLDSMEKEGTIVSLQAYDRIYTTPSSTWSSWLWQRMTPNLVASFSSTHPSSLYVVMPSVKEIAHHIHQTYTRLPVKTNVNSLMTFADFRKQYGNCYHRPLTDNDLKLLLRYLASKSKVVIEDGVHGYGSVSFMVIKFIEPNMPYKVTEQDKAMISIKTTCDALQYQTHEMQQQVEKLAISAHEHNLKKQKPQTLYALRRKRHIMDVLDKRLRSLAEMETLLLKMESAQDDMQIVQAFDNGAKSLRSIFATGLSVQSVEETMARIQEAYDDQKDVEQAMVDGSTYLTENDGTHYDDDLLLKELEELEQQEQQERKESPSQEISQRLEASWPSVPSASLQPSSNTSTSSKHVVEQPSPLKEALLSTSHASKNESHSDQSPKIAELL